jgi:ASC-1-like (ASCH) protein
MTHELKIEPQYFKEIISGKKKFELRKNDRNFQVGNILILKDVFDSGKCYHAHVTSIIHGPIFGLEEGYCIMSIE